MVPKKNSFNCTLHGTTPPKPFWVSREGPPMSSISSAHYGQRSQEVGGGKGGGKPR